MAFWDSDGWKNFWGLDQNGSPGFGQKFNPVHQSNQAAQGKPTSRQYDQIMQNKRNLPSSSANNSTISFNDFVKKNNNGRDMFGQGGPHVFGVDPVVDSAPDVPQGPDNSILEGYMTEIQDRLARAKATSPNIRLDTKPIENAQASSVAALAKALETVIGSVNTARGNTNSAYSNARTDTQNAYNAIEDRSRVEGKAAAKESGEVVSDELAKSASVAMSGINQDLTESDDLMSRAMANLGGSNAVAKSINQKVDPNNSTETIRNNISQNYQDRAGNAASQTGRDINASARYADTIGTDGASAIASLMSELAGRNNQYDRDIADAQSANAGNRASLDSAYADKLMQGQLAQQQEQSRVDQQAWQTNTGNDSNALQGMIDLMKQEGDSRNEMEMFQLNRQSKNDQAEGRAQSDQILAVLKGLVGNTEKNTLDPDAIKQILAQITG